MITGISLFGLVFPCICSIARLTTSPSAFSPFFRSKTAPSLARFSPRFDSGASSTFRVVIFQRFRTRVSGSSFCPALGILDKSSHPLATYFAYFQP